MKTKLMLAVLCATSFSPVIQAAPAEPITYMPPPSQPRCQISSTTSEIDFGTMTRGKLQEAKRGSFTFGKRTLSLNVACQSPQDMRFVLQGDVGVSGELNFGDGGRLDVTLVSVQLDGHTAYLSTFKGEGNGYAAVSGLLKAGDTYLVTDGSRALKGRSLTIQMEVSPIVTEQNARTTSLTINQGRISFLLLEG